MNRAVDSTQEWRINSTAMKVNEAFNAARAAARDECLWLSKVCRELLADNDARRSQIDHLTARLAEAEHQLAETQRSRESKETK